MVCKVCHIGTSTVHPVYGQLPCVKCRAKQRSLPANPQAVEFTTDSIKEQRQAYWKDIMPMHRGTLNKAWLDRYGEKKAKQRGFSDQEIKHAEYNWDELTYYKHG